MAAPTPVIHHCIAVANLDATADYFRSALGAEFGPFRKVPMRTVGAVTATADINFVHTTDGRFELIQTVPGAGLFGDSANHGFHHTGSWATTHLDEAVEKARSAGEEVDYEVFVEDIKIAVFLKPTHVRPVRLELLSPALRDLTL